MFHKNQNQTTEDASFVSHTACIKHRLRIYFYQEIIPFYKKSHIFRKLKMSISVECHRYWMYLESNSDLADDTSLGLSQPNQDKVKSWVNGPEFLWKDESSWVNQGDKKVLELNEENPEVKATVTVNINKVDDEEIVPQILNTFSSCCNMLRVTAWEIQGIKLVRHSVNEGNKKFDGEVSIGTLSIEELKEIELKVIQAYQNIYFENEIKKLKAINY